MDITRRVLTSVLLIAAACIACGSRPAEAQVPRRLNVLWICADDHAPYVMGAYGNHRVRTPNLDRLAATGMRFDRAYCNSPVCTASRQSFITGRYPRTLGVTQLKTALPASEKTLADYLKAAGYRTAAIGKMHFNSALNHGFDLRLDLDDHRRALQARGPKPIPPDIPVQPPWKPFKDPARIWLNSAVRPAPAVEADMAGTWFAEEAARYLGERDAAPFFLFVSFYEPHSPFFFPVEDRGRIDSSSFEAPVVGPEDAHQIPAVFRDLSDSEKRGIAAAYCTSVEFLDRNVGRVLDALDRSGHACDTLVIYTGDHGYFLGQHGRFEKHSCFEEAIRGPLLIRAPRVTQHGSASQAFVEFIDIAPTALDLCCVQTPPEMQGQSLVRLLCGESRMHRSQVFIEYAPNDEACVRDEHWKLIFERGQTRRTDGYDPGGPLPGRTVRLYDLEHDPQELKNVAAAPEHAERKQRMLELLSNQLERTAREPELIPKTADVLERLDFLVQSRDVVNPKGGASEPGASAP